MVADGANGKRRGMDQARRHADKHWWACMLASGTQVALRKPWLYTDDIVAWCAEHHPNARTHEPRAIGPLMRELCKLGVIEKTASWVPSAQAQNHKRPMQVWWSLAYRGRVPHGRRNTRHRSLDPRQLDLGL